LSASNECTGFRLVLEHGESVLANRVAIAAGISSFTWRPPEFDGLPSSLATHTSQHVDFQRFAGKEVLVIGGGQSALESAALLHEVVRLLNRRRTRQIRWLGALSREPSIAVSALRSRNFFTRQRT